MASSQLCTKNERESSARLEAMIMQFPDWMEGIHIGSMGACPVRDDIKTLRAGQDVNDEVIRGVLGLRIDGIKTKQRRTTTSDGASAYKFSLSETSGFGQRGIFRHRCWHFWSSGRDFEPKTRSAGAGFEY